METVRSLSNFTLERFVDIACQQVKKVIVDISSDTSRQERPPDLRREAVEEIVIMNEALFVTSQKAQ